MMPAITAVRRLGSHSKPAATPSSREGMSQARRRANASGSTLYAAKASAKRARSRSLCAPALANRRAMPATIKYPNAGSSMGEALRGDHDGRRRADMFNESQQLAGCGGVDVDAGALVADPLLQLPRIASER